MKGELPPILLVIEQARYASCSSFALLDQYRVSRDEGAFRALVAREGPMVYAISYGESTTHETAIEAFQETFLELVRRGHMIRDEAKLGAWLRQVARRTARQMTKRDRDRRRIETARAQEAAGTVAVPADEALTALEQTSRVWREVRLLGDRYRTPLELRYLAGMSPPEIARRLDVPEKTVKTRLLRGLKKLRPALQRLGLGAVVIGTADVARSGTMPSALVARTSGFVARAVQEGGGRVGNGLVGLQATWRWVAATLLVVGIATGIAWVARDKPAPPVVVDPPRAVENLQAKNLRIFRDELLPKLLDESRRTMPADNQVSVTAVRALGSEVEVELRPVRPIPNFFPVALRLRYCVLRREMSATADVAGTGTWVGVDSTRPITIDVPLPLVPFGKIPVVAGRDRWAWARDTFALLPPDPRGEEELIRHLFGSPGGDLVLPGAYASGFDGGLIVQADRGLFVRDRVGRWRYAGECPGWNPVVIGDRVYCSGHGAIRSRPLDDPKALWVRFCDEPPVEKDQHVVRLFAGGGRLFVTVQPPLALWTRPVQNAAAGWERVTQPIWSHGIAETGGILFGNNRKNLLARPFAKPEAEFVAVGPWPTGCEFLVADGDQLLAFGLKPGPIYARSKSARPVEAWKIVGRVHDPYKR